MPKKGKLLNVLRVRVEVIRRVMGSKYEKIVFLRNSFNANYWKEKIR